MNTPADLRYSSEHEWVRLEADIATVGITDFAQSELGDIVFVELPSEGDTVAEMGRIRGGGSREDPCRISTARWAGP